MVSKSSQELHHHFPKLAEEAGFAFNTHRTRHRVDWAKIRHIDVDSLVRERRFSLVEQHMNDILNCVLESEFDVRILDEGVLKMFRLAQLSVEYQLFCRHYLDRSVYVLREELQALVQELDTTKKDLREKEEDIRKLKRKTKHTYRPPLPYGNDNIATMILKTLTKNTDIFPSTSNGDTLQHNKCTYCDKIFLNQLYLRSHMSRRHGNVTEIPQKDVAETVHVQQDLSDKENSKLNEEITELRSKLQEMEKIISTVQRQSNIPQEPQPKEDNQAKVESPQKNNGLTISSKVAKTKDAEVSTSQEDFFLDKIEEWKREEYEKYNKEIHLLRAQIIETMNSFKEKERQPVSNDAHLIEQLHTTIKHQGTEIVALKQELINSRRKSKDEEHERKNEVNVQMAAWSKRVEAQTKQYEVLLQKLNEVGREAQEARAVAEAERERAAQLQIMLHQAVNDEPKRHNSTEKRSAHNSNSKTSVPLADPPKTKKTITDRKSLEKLHRRAQELLRIASQSSSDTSESSGKPQQILETKPSKSLRDTNPSKMLNVDNVANKQHNIIKINGILENKSYHSPINKPHEVKKQQKIKKDKPLSQTAPEVSVASPIRTPGSPVKLVRAKITEEVNNRLVSVGVDPLKSRLAQTVFRRQRIQLQQQYEIKSKKNPAYQRVKHKILTYLDSNTSNITKEAEPLDYSSPSKLSKTFSLTSVISNVKSKALSLVKNNDISYKAKQKSINSEVAKKALSLLRTPPGSTPTSPIAVRRDTVQTETRPDPDKDVYRSVIRKKYNISKPQTPVQGYRNSSITSLNDSDEKSNESDHKYYNSVEVPNAFSSVETLIKSPARRPSSASNISIPKYTIHNGLDPVARTRSASNLQEPNAIIHNKSTPSLGIDSNESDDVESINIPIKKAASVENVRDEPKRTKSVLKNASSTSSLNKKKVLFDMEAIQMKSVSASPSQSTEKSDGMEKYELGLVNLDNEEWDISSIENEPLKNDTKLQISTRASPKIEELKQTIEAQLARRTRTETASTAIVGGVDVLAGPMGKAASLAGSNTSLGSSILDESESLPVVNNKAFVKSKATEKDDSEIDISEYSLDGLINKKGNESF